jgi:hypothetical protein
MVEFLKSWDDGVNVFAIVVNVRAPRFDQGTQKLVKLVNQFFNNPQFWNQVCIVFTNCYPSVPFNKEVKKNRYREEVCKLIRECQGSAATEPQLPVFFVDSPSWRTDQNTADELTALHAFVCQKDALPTHHVVAPDVSYLAIHREERREILVDTEILGPKDGDQSRVQTYEDQVREKRTAYNGGITYSDWTATRRWQVWAKATVRPQRCTELVSERCEDITETVEDVDVPMTVMGLGCLFTAAVTALTAGAGGIVLAGTGSAVGQGLLRNAKGTRLVVVGHKVTRQYREKERIVTTDFDGKESYGDWRILGDWEDEQVL